LTSARAQIAFSRLALMGAAATLLLMGMLAAAYGPLLAFLMRRFQVGLPVAGLVFGAHFSGGFLGVLVSMRGLERIRGRVALSGSLALLGLGCAGVALAPSWPLLLGAVFLIGIGFGALDIGINQLIAHSANPGRVAMLNVLNGAYALGAVVAPLLIAAAGDRYPGLYAGGAVMAAVVILGWRGVSGGLAAHVSSGPAVGSDASLILTFVIAFMLYVGVEIGVAGWMPTHLQGIGYSVVAAARLTSGFWFALAVGRFLIAPLASRVPEPFIVLGGAGIAVLALAAALVPAAAPAAYILAGLAIAPIFPTGLAWLARLNPGNPRATAWLFPAAMLGGALIPTGIGVLIAGLGTAWVPAVLAAVATGCLAAFAAAARHRVTVSGE
jgi:MFS transporter, FHS family, glucose/mannose:H+ symporter